MRVYIAGPMRGIPLYNFPAFHEAAARGRARGLEIVSPAELDIAAGIIPPCSLPPGFFAAAIQRDIAALVQCDGIALLPGWKRSKGVAVELAIARLLDISVLDAQTWTSLSPG